MIYKPVQRYHMYLADPYWVQKYGRLLGWGMIYACRIGGWLYQAALVAAIVVCAKLVFS